MGDPRWIALYVFVAVVVSLPDCSPPDAADPLVFQHPPTHPLRPGSHAAAATAQLENFKPHSQAEQRPLVPPGRWRPDTHTPVLWDPAAASWQLDPPDQERQLLAKCFLLCSEQHRRVATLAGRQEFGGNVCSQTSQTAPCQQLIHLSSSLDSCFRMPAGDMVSATCYIAKVRSSQRWHRSTNADPGHTSAGDVLGIPKPPAFTHQELARLKSLHFACRGAGGLL